MKNEAEKSILEWLILPDEESARYTNYGDGRAGDSSDLVAKVNADSALNKGHSDCRLPTKGEMVGLMGADDAPNEGWFWTSSPCLGISGWAGYFSFGNGGANGSSRILDIQVRLVRTNNPSLEIGDVSLEQLPVTVFLEGKDRACSEKIAMFATEDLYIACLPVLEALAVQRGCFLTESIADSQ